MIFTDSTPGTTGVKACCRSTPRPTRARFASEGGINFALPAVIVLVLLSGFLEIGRGAFNGGRRGRCRAWSARHRPRGDPGLLQHHAVDSVHESESVSWAPMAEVAKLFAGIFLDHHLRWIAMPAGIDGSVRGCHPAVTHSTGSPIQPCTGRQARSVPRQRADLPWCSSTPRWGSAGDDDDARAHAGRDFAGAVFHGANITSATRPT